MPDTVDVWCDFQDEIESISVRLEHARDTGDEDHEELLMLRLRSLRNRQVKLFH